MADGARNGELPEGIVDAGLLELEIHRVDETKIVTFRGELDLSNADTARSTLEALEREDGADLLLDLGELEFCDSTGLALIVSAASRCRDNGHGLKLLKAGPSVQRVFKLTGLEDQLPFVD